MESIKDKRICVMIEDDVDKNLRLLQAKLIQRNNKSYSYSDTINHALGDLSDKKGVSD